MKCNDIVHGWHKTSSYIDQYILVFINFITLLYESLNEKMDEMYKTSI